MEQSKALRQDAEAGDNPPKAQEVAAPQSPLWYSAEKLSGEFADKHVELVKIGMRELRKEADNYDAPDEFSFDTPMFDELSVKLRQVRDEEGAFALHCLIDRSKYKIYEWNGMSLITPLALASTARLTTISAGWTIAAFLPPPTQPTSPTTAPS